MKAQDILVALALLERPPDERTYPALATELGLSASEAHAAVRRLQGAGLVGPERNVIRHALLEFLLHGLKYVFPVRPGGPALGIPTGGSAPSLKAAFPPPDPAPWVWPSPEGTERGLELPPLYRTVPDAALRDPQLHELLALVDALRAGRARERALAEQRLRERIQA